MINKDITIDIEGNEAKLTLYILDSSPELYYEKRHDMERSKFSVALQ